MNFIPFFFVNFDFENQIFYFFFNFSKPKTQENFFCLEDLEDVFYSILFVNFDFKNQIFYFFLTF